MDGTSVIERQAGRPAETGHPVPDRNPQRRDGTPRILARLWADEAANGLVRRSPEHSARERGFSHLIALAGFLVPAALTGLALKGPGILGLLALTLSPVFAAQTLLRLAAALLAPRWAPKRDLPVRALPAASLVVALYREAAVLDQLIAALKAIDYPRDRLEIKLALETGDTRTREALASIALDERFEVVLVPPGRPQTKPRALNHALRFCTGEIVGVLDAEDRPHPRQLRCAAESFSLAPAELVCLQAPLNWFNRAESWLTRQFALEYAAHFHGLLPLYNRLGWPLPLGGTSNYFRTAALRRAGAWDAWNVTEDADLGVRLHRMGLRCGLIAPMTLEEAPVGLAAWIPQRTRWLKGYLQTLAVHAAAGRKPGRRLLSLGLTLGGAILSALACGPSVVIVLAAILLTGDAAGLTVLAGLTGTGWLAAALCAWRAAYRAGVPVRTGDLLTLPVYEAIKFWPAVRALYQLVTNPYHWEKTEHGVSALSKPSPCISPSPPRSSRSASSSRSSSSPAGAPASRSVRNAVRE
jgi:hypothetical protein